MLSAVTRSTRTICSICSSKFLKICIGSLYISFTDNSTFTEQIFKNLEEHIEHIALVLLVTALSMIAYFLTSPQPPRERTKSAFAGGVIAGVLSYQTWALIGSMTPSGHLHVGWLTVIIFIYSVSGQFIPEFLQSVIPKLAKKLFNRSYKAKTGEDFEDDH